jgi:hypothetical protein
MRLLVRDSKAALTVSSEPSHHHFPVTRIDHHSANMVAAKFAPRGLKAAIDLYGIV